MRFARYSWPAEFVVRAIKEVGWQNFSLDKDAVAARHHGAAAVRAAERRRVAARRRVVLDGDDAGPDELRGDARGEPEGIPWRRVQAEGQTPQALLAAMLDRVTPAPFDAAPQQALMSYLFAAGVVDWRGEQLTRGPRGWRVSSSAPPNTNSFKEDDHAHISTTLYP